MVDHSWRDFVELKNVCRYLFSTNESTHRLELISLLTIRNRELKLRIVGRSLGRLRKS